MSAGFAVPTSWRKPWSSDTEPDFSRRASNWDARILPPPAYTLAIGGIGVSTKSALRVRFAMMAVLAVVGLSPAACRREVQKRPATVVVRLMTGTPGGGFYPVGAALAAAFKKSVPSLRMDHRESAGSISNVTALQHGDADIALAYADVAYLSFTGGLAAQHGRFDHLRGIAVLQLASVHLVVSARSGVKDPSELRGRHVGVGTVGSGTALTAGLILRAFGLEPSSVRTETLRYNDAAARVAAGDLDAMFVIGSDPVDAVRMATAAGARVLPLSGPAIDRLRHDYPFFHLAVVRSGAYPGQREAIRTIGVENLLLCRDTLPEQIVHDVTGRLFELQPSVGPLREMDLDHAPAVPIPLHEGAARFYREREVFH
jgi:TRAP transporter TAXI family solute receptor